jgi:hypothetical protein
MGFAAQTVTRMRYGRTWRAISWILLIAFAVQSYATQTHIHPTPSVTGRVAIEKAASDGKAPFENGAVSCPFCQVIVHSGVFSSPMPPLLVLPAWAVLVVFVRPARTFSSSATTQGWQSRAPPSV